MGRYLALIVVGAIAVSLASCGQNGSQNGGGPGGGGAVFSPANPGGSSNSFMDFVKKITRWDTSEHGGGQASSMGLSVQRVSIGGSYLHKPSDDGTVQINPGIHGNPHASQ